jgi:hypothetical protein
MAAVGRFWVWALLMAAVPVAGQEAAVVMAPAVAAPAALQDVLTVPALTFVTLQIDNAILSRRAKRGDRFALTMLNELSVDGVVVVPRGSRGEGEVVHAAGTGFSGGPGELLIAARFLVVDGKKLPLQGLRISRMAFNKDTDWDMMLVALGGSLGGAAADSITRTNVDIAAGQIAIAKTAQAF